MDRPCPRPERPTGSVFGLLKSTRSTHHAAQDRHLSCPHDTSKNALHMVGLDERGAIVLREKVTRHRIAARLVNVQPCLIGIEAGMATHNVAWLRLVTRSKRFRRLIPSRFDRATRTTSETPTRLRKPSSKSGYSITQSAWPAHRCGIVMLSAFGLFFKNWCRISHVALVSLFLYGGAMQCYCLK
jgi:hypothetical protein